MQRAKDKVSGFIFWGAALRFLFQGYLELCLSIFIGWYSINWSRDASFQTIYSNIFTITFTVILLILPIWITVFFCYNQKKLNEPSYRRKYGTLYDELDISVTRLNGNKLRTSILFNSLFVFRRLVFALSAILMGEYLFF